MADDDIPALRVAVTDLAERFGKQAVARDSGVNPDTLYRFLGGEDLTPRTRHRLADYARRVSTPPAVGTSTTVGVRAPVEAPPVHPAETKPGYWEGRVAETIDQFEAATARLRAFHAAADRWEAATVLARQPAPQSTTAPAGEAEAGDTLAPRPAPDVYAREVKKIEEGIAARRPPSGRKRANND